MASIANDDNKSDVRDVIGIATLAPEFPMMALLAEEAVRRIEQRGGKAEHILRESSVDQIRQSTEPHLLMAGLDAFIAAWETGNAEGSAKLLDNLTPVGELVRDHQAFLMVETRNAQELKSRFARAHGAAGPMSIGGLTPAGRRDHLVAMMLMDTVGQDSTLYPYQEYNSLESLAVGLLTGEIDLASIPVSQALQMPMEGGISMVATTARERQDVTTRVPTLRSARIDLSFANYIGLYRPSAADESSEQLSSYADLSVASDWPEQVYELGLVDEYANEGAFSVNVLRELSRLQRFSQMLDR